MKLKYYMRGIGVGIVFTVLLFFFLQPERKMSQNEIIAAAKKLGMVEVSQNDINLDAIKNPTQPVTGDAVAADNSGENGQPQENQDISPLPEVSPTEEITPMLSPLPTTTDIPTPTPTDIPAPTPTDKPEPTKAASNEEGEYVTVTITKGMTSWKFALYAKQIGLIENTEEFDSYLVKNGYANRIRINTFKIKKGSSYYEIAEKITGS